MRTVILFLFFMIMFSATAFSQVDRFRSLEHRYTGGGYTDALFRYRLFEPTTVVENQEYPLVVWLHGYGEYGSDNKSQLAWVYSFMDFEHTEDFPYFVLVMQCPEDNIYWTHVDQVSTSEINGDKGDGMLTILEEVLDKTLLENTIDINRIYLIGICSGGDGCWEMAMRNPNRFAAVSTLADYGGDYNQLENLVETPIWCFHSQGDFPDRKQKLVQTLKRLGGSCYLTETPSDRHDCWTTAFEDYNLQKWLFAQNLASSRGPEPGALTWSSVWNVTRRDFLCWDFLISSFLSPGVLLLFIAFCIHELRCRFRLAN